MQCGKLQSEPRNLLEQGFGASKLQQTLLENVRDGGQQHGKQTKERSVERNIVERPGRTRLHFDGSQGCAQQQQSHPMRSRMTKSDRNRENTDASAKDRR